MTSYLLLDDYYLFFLVVVLEHHFDNLGVACLHVFPHVVGLNREFPVTAVDENGELHASRPPEVDEFIQRRSYGAAGIEHVVDQYYGAVGDVGRDIGFVDDRARSYGGQVVAIECYVQLTGWRALALQLLDPIGNSLGEGNAASPDPNQQQIVGPYVALDDLRSQPRKRPGDTARIHN